MIINACLIFYLCWKLLTGKAESLNWGTLLNYLYSGVFEMILFDLMILSLTGVIK